MDEATLGVHAVLGCDTTDGIVDKGRLVIDAKTPKDQASGGFGCTVLPADGAPVTNLLWRARRWRNTE